VALIALQHDHMNVRQYVLLVQQVWVSPLDDFREAEMCIRRTAICATFYSRSPPLRSRNFDN